MAEKDTETIPGYRNVSEEDQKKAQVFFDRGKTVADTGNYEYAIEMYLQGLAIDPDAVDAHQALREISLKRKASGGKGLGMMEAMKLKRAAKEDKQAMLNAEKLLAYDPGNTDHMLALMQGAQRAGFYDTAVWIGNILRKANIDSKKPDFHKFMALKDVYKEIGEWKLAVEACQYAAQLRPDDMDLQTELKNLGAQLTMSAGKYGSGRSYRESLRDRETQQRLIEMEKDVVSLDAHQRAIAEAEAEWKAEPNELGKFRKLINALQKTEETEYENRAIDLLEEMYRKTGQFNFRMTSGQIKLAQLNRMERTMRTNLKANPTDAGLKQQYAQFLQEKAQEELAEYTLWLENYPSNNELRFNIARRLFDLQRYDEAIGKFQEAANDPKFRNDARMFLGRSFLEAGFVDEAVDTLKGLISEYQLKGDDRSKAMYYWCGRALEQKGDPQDALKHYSQVAQWDFNYLDVQTRIKSLRAAAR